MKRVIFILLALVLSLIAVDARYSPGLEIAEGENITLNGGYVTGAPQSSDGVSVYSVDGVNVIALNHLGEVIDKGDAGAGGDCTRVINAGLASLNETYSGFSTYGIFHIDDDLIIPDGVGISWAGHNSVILDDTTNSTDHDSMIRDEDPTTVKEYNTTWAIRDLMLDGIDKASVDYGINVSRVRHAHLENVNILHMQEDGFLLRDDSWMTMLHNCKTYDNKYSAVHFAAGENDQPNGCIIYGGRFMADDTVGVYIEAGGDIRLIGADVESTGTAVYILDNSCLVSGCYFEACTNGLYLGSGGVTVYNANIRDNAFYSVTNPITFVNCAANSVKMSGNRDDGVSVDEWIGTGTGTGGWQTIAIPSTYPGTISSISAWYTESGIVDYPSIYVASGNLYIYAINGRDYKYCATFGA